MAKSVYGRVRAAQARSAMKSAKISGYVNNFYTGVGVLAAVTGNPAVGLMMVSSGLLATSGIAARQKDAARMALRAKAIGGLVERSQRAKGAAASIARARGVIAQTAALRSAAASRKVVPRPAAVRRPAAERKGGDGQTEGYYRNQGGKRVYVQGYATPAGRSR